MGGLYDILEAQRLQDPKFTYEGLYQDPMSKLATANPLKAIFNPNFEYRAPSFIDRFAKEGATNLQGYVPIDYDRAVDFKRLFEDRPLKPTDGTARFEGFNPRVGTITPFQPSDPRSFQSIFPTNVQKGIMTQTPQNFEFLSSAYEDDADDKEQEFLPDQKKSSGIADLFRTLIGFAVPGAGFLMNLGRGGFDGIRSLNQRLRNTDFGRSRTGAEYAMLRRERKQGERAQEAMPDVYKSAREQGFTNQRGGFSTQRADRAGTSVGSGQFSSKRSTGRQGY